MTTRTLFLICVTAAVMSASVAFAGPHGRGYAAARPAGARPAARFGPMAGNSPGTFHRWNGVASSGQFRNWNGNWNGNRNNWNNGNWHGNNWNANNWHGNNWNGNWHGNNWNGHCNNWHGHWNGCRNVVFYGGGFGGYPWYYPYSYFNSYYPYGGYPAAYVDLSYSSAADQYYYGSSDDGSYSEPVYNGGNGGNSGSVVAEVQRGLARDGYYHGPIDGAMGSRTYYAIRAYERDHQLRADGQINQPLLAAMRLR